MYTENPDKLHFKLNGYSTGVKISITCQEAYGTLLSFGEFHSCECRGTEKIPNPNGAMVFEASTYILGDDFKIYHTITQEQGETLEYVFPDDYNESPEFDFEDDDTVRYRFTINFS